MPKNVILKFPKVEEVKTVAKPVVPPEVKPVVEEKKPEKKRRKWSERTI